ncbi:substrate-binding domain-containing protein [Cohnella ginsengisoli]|uniref:substrate-binding domain-containing protein n=1 Tax=Cohnella ginsengisoli TaxID=425004 RepID=UPI0030B8E562
MQAHAEKGIVVDRELWLSVTSTLPSAYTDENKARDIEKIKRHLLDHPEISAFFAMEYNIALLVREAARQLGLDVPQDLSIICFDCPDNGSGFSFTHLRQNQEEMGRAAFENVLQLRDGKTVPPKITLEAELIVGKSTAVPSPSRIGQL